MPLKTEPLNLADLLKTPEDQAEFLRVSMEEGDLAEINHALGIIARARGMTEVARASGLGRESLYKALREDSRPEFGTILRVMKALGLKLTVELA
jgi:probable addiction module antidote protein